MNIGGNIRKERKIRKWKKKNDINGMEMELKVPKGNTLSKGMVIRFSCGKITKITNNCYKMTGDSEGDYSRWRVRIGVCREWKRHPSEHCDAVATGWMSGDEVTLWQFKGDERG